jgi:pimeloyl-ACP methyl ester carboxylesterase
MHTLRASSLMMSWLLPGVLLLAGCGTNTSRGAPAVVLPEEARAGELSTLTSCEYQPADSKAKFAAGCGTLVVPENWDKAGSRLVALPIVRITATGPTPAEPVFYLQGGPGQSNFSWAPPDWLLRKHDVVFVGYRGIDGTVTLACPEVNGTLKAHTGKDLFSEKARTAYAAAAQDCATRFQQEGIDLSGYTIPGVIGDIEAVRSALGYERIDLLSESYGTRVAQIYAYMHPDSLHRLILIGVNTPGHFIWDPAVFDELLGHISQLCARDVSCSSRTSNLAQTIYKVNHNMPRRWLFFNIDPDTVRLGTQFLLLDNPNMPMIFDMYLAAEAGDPSGLAMANLLTSLAPIDQQVFGDLCSKAGSVDTEKYRGVESVSLGDSVMGAPMAEWIWPMAEAWPTQMIPKDLREFQQTNVEMLLVNGTVDFSTPPTALDEAKPYFHRAQLVLLPEFGHIADVMTLQPAAFERLVTSYYDTGVADDSLFAYQPVSFKPGFSLTLAARVLVAGLVVIPALVLLGVFAVVSGVRRRRSAKVQ